jgi:heme exporter protein C
MAAQARHEYPASRTRILNILTIVTVLGMALTFYLALFYAGTDVEQGNVQRIFYMHVGAFTGGTTAFFITVIAGIAFLRTRNYAWDRLGVASVEIGLPLMTITLLTGAVWARPTWNTWWTSDPRLNTMAVMWLLYAAYLTLRSAITSPDRRARYAAVYGILAFVSVIYTFAVIRLRTDTLHPCVVGPCPASPTSQGAFPINTDLHIGMTLGIGSIFWMLLAITLTWHRLRVENLAARVEELKMRVLSEAEA